MGDGPETEEPAPKRFAACDENDLAVILAGRVLENTKRSAQKWLQVVETHIAEKEAKITFASCTPEELGQFLLLLYAELRQQDGTPYSKSSIMGCRSAAHRHLKNLGREVDIYKRRCLFPSKSRPGWRAEKMKCDGRLKPTKHKESVTGKHKERLCEDFKEANHDPVVLTDQVRFLVTYHFCIRARETQANLTVDNLEFENDDDGKVSISLSTAYATKKLPRRTIRRRPSVNRSHSKTGPCVCSDAANHEMGIYY